MEVMRLRDVSTLSDVGRRLCVAAIIGCALAVGACGKRGPLEGPQIVTGVDEEGKEITEQGPPPDYASKSFILDPILF